MLPFGPTTPAGACTVFFREERRSGRKERFSDEGEKRAREKTRRRKSIGGRWKEKRGGRKTRRGDEGKGRRRTKEGYAVEKVVDIEEGRGRVGSAASKGCQGGGTNARGEESEW